MVFAFLSKIMLVLHGLQLLWVHLRILRVGVTVKMASGVDLMKLFLLLDYLDSIDVFPTKRFK